MHMPNVLFWLLKTDCRVQYPGQTKLLYVVHLCHHGCLFYLGLQICSFRSHLMWFPWQQQTLNSFSLVFLFGQFYIHQLYLRNTKTFFIDIILDTITVCHFTAFQRLNVSYIASDHSNGTPNTSKTQSIPSIGPIALYMIQHTTDQWQKTLKSDDFSILRPLLQPSWTPS